MSMTDDAPFVATQPVEEEEQAPTVSSVPPVSFKDRLARRRQELESDAVFEMPVPGYDDLWARYRVLGYEEIRNVGLRVEAETREQVAGERLTAAATLAEANIDLLEYKGQDDQGRPIFEALGYRWSWRAAQDLFGVENAEGMTARDALLHIFPYPRDMLLANHFQEYLELGMSFLPRIEEVLQGESRAPLGPTTSDS